MKNRISSKLFYVYELVDDEGTVFYVGKGSGNRVLDHWKEAKRDCDCPRCQVFHTVHMRHEKVSFRIVHETDDEPEAYRVETETIKKYGLSALTNRYQGSPGRNSVDGRGGIFFFSVTADDHEWLTALPNRSEWIAKKIQEDRSAPVHSSVRSSGQDEAKSDQS